MNTDTIFAKTAAGMQEIEHRKLRLDIRHRSLLIMLDGKRSVDEVAAVMGHADTLPGMLAHLFELGLIEAPGVAVFPVASTYTGTAAQTPVTTPSMREDWKALRQNAVQAVNDLLGPMGESLAIRLEELKSPEGLPDLLEHCCKVVQDLRDAKSAAKFRDALGLSGN